jgi:hypothetical protein
MRLDLAGCAACLFVVACGGHRAPASYVRYQNGHEAVDIRLSTSGRMAAMKTMLPAGGYELRLWQREPYEQMVARGAGTLVGVPNDRDVLVIDDANHLRWLRDKREAAIALPSGGTWSFVSGTTDEPSHTALLAFVGTGAGTPDVVLVEVDSQTLTTRGSRELAGGPGGCGGAGAGRTLYLWCDQSETRWNVTRNDGLATAWSSAIDVKDPFIRTEMRGQVTGDASALVLLYGSQETSRMRFGPRDAWSVSAADGHARMFTSHEPLYFLESLTPIAGRSEVGAVRWLYRDFYGVLVLDARTATTRLVVEPTDTLSPYALAARPDGMLLIP